MSIELLEFNNSILVQRQVAPLLCIHWSFLLLAECAGCKEELVEGQALIALDQQWHIWCFKCAVCSTVLHGEYMGK